MLVPLACALLAAGAPSAPAGAPSDHYELRLTGPAASPLWWSPLGHEAGHALLRVDGTTRVDVGPLPVGVTVVAHARAVGALSTVHVHAARADDASNVLPLARDPVPAREKTVTLAGPGSFVVLVDPGASGPYDIRVTFDGFAGDPSSGARARFPLIVQGSYRCPLGPPAACPP